MEAVKGDTKSLDYGSCIKGSIYHQGGLGGGIIWGRGLVLTAPCHGYQAGPISLAPMSTSKICHNDSLIHHYPVYVCMFLIAVLKTPRLPEQCLDGFGKLRHGAWDVLERETSGFPIPTLSVSACPARTASTFSRHQHSGTKMGMDAII